MDIAVAALGGSERAGMTDPGALHVLVTLDSGLWATVLGGPWIGWDERERPRGERERGRCASDEDCGPWRPRCGVGEN